MYSIKVNQGKTFKIDLQSASNQFEGTLNGVAVNGNFTKINSRQYQVLYNDRVYQVDIHKINHEEKTLVLKINAVKFNLELKDKYDELLHTLGLDKMAARKTGDVKAPMPGMVLNILVHEGDQVKKGDALLVLEAMKMENILKSPADGVIRKVAAVKGTAVEKNQLLFQF